MLQAYLASEASYRLAVAASYLPVVVAYRVDLVVVASYLQEVVAYLVDAVEDLKKVYRKIASAFSNTADE